MSFTSGKTRTNVNLDAEIKRQAQEIFKRYDIGLSYAFNIFLAQVVMKRGIPFEVKIPNKETAQTMKYARAGKYMSYVLIEELKKEAGT